MNRKAFAGFAATAAVALGAFLLARPGAGQPVGKEKATKQVAAGTLNASGVGTVDLTADTAHIHMTLSATGKDRTSALESLREQKDKLVNALKKQGFDQIRVGFIASSSAEATGQPQPAGMAGMMGMVGGGPAPEPKAKSTVYLPMTVVVQKAGDYPGLVKTIDAVRTLAADHGAANAAMTGFNPYSGYNSPGVVLSNSKEHEASTRARVLALRDSVENAKHLAQEAGIKLRDIIAVSEPAPQLGMGMIGMGGMGMVGFGGMGMNFDQVTGQKKIIMSVSVTYGH